MGWQRLWRWVAIGGLAASCFAATPAPSVACSCADVSIEPDVIFVGRVVFVAEGKRVRRLLRAWQDGFGSTVALLAVELSWQGPRWPFFAVVGGTGQADCTLDFAPGATYLINGFDRGPGPLETSICAGSRQMEETDSGES